jgi:hypothetical protein
VAETTLPITEATKEEPDEVRVGGDVAGEATVEGAEFYIDGDHREVVIDVPGAFEGQSSDGHKYRYVEEPVEIVNDGEVVQSGVVDDIIHEETKTILILGT